MSASIDRRSMFRGAAAIGATTAIGGLLRPAAGWAQADAAPATSAANAAHYRFAIGDIRATVISDGDISGHIRIYAGDAPQADLDAVLAAAGLSQEQFVLQLNATLLEVGGRKVLIDPGANLNMGPNGGKLLGRLAGIGVAPGDIDAVVITHAHPDHLSNLRMADGTPTFPNAAVHVPDPDWRFFIAGDPDLTHLPMPPAFREQFIANIKTSLEAVAPNVVRYDPGQEILPGITTIPAFGHTPGMSALLIASGDDQLMVTADIAYHPLLNIDHAWRPGVDVDAEAAERTRNALFDRTAADQVTMLGFHFPFPGLGRLYRSGDNYTWMPQSWEIGA